MNDKNIELAQKFVKASYVKLGNDSINKRQNILKQILSQRQLPDEGLDDLTIRYFLDTFALMDSNNFHEKIGVGQRQSRIFSNLVKERHFYMGHGIGRSGDMMANQPKAAGSSLLLQITRYLTVSALKQLHYNFVSDVLIMPLATGMGLTMAFLTLASQQPDRKYVIWSRIDQKTCLKSIATANLVPIVVDLKVVDDYLECDYEAIQKTIQQIGAEKILCIVSTTSCFAPRIPDDVQKNSLIAKKYKIFHVVNNAYGLWCSKIAHKIKQGYNKGQCTIVVQSTDKNFMVPVGGCLIFAQKQQILQKISSKYPGRANASPIVDMFITLLSMGKNTLKKLQQDRKDSYKYFKEKMNQYAKKVGQRVLQTPANTISMAMRLQKLSLDDPSQLGSILYSKRVMGHRIVKEDMKMTKVGGIQFKNYGSHHNNINNLPYITFAAALGTTKSEIDEFIVRLDKCIKQLTKKKGKKKQQSQIKTMQMQQKQTKQEIHQTKLIINLEVSENEQIENDNAQKKCQL